MNISTRAILVLVALCAACAGTGTRSSLSKDAKILDLPITIQDRMYDCGLVSLSALCKYWNTEIPEAEQVRLSNAAAENEGLSGAEVCAALDDLGFETFLFRGTLDHQATGLFKHIDARRPALVMLASDSGTHHYVLFIGYDATERNACLLDPVRGRVLVPYETFESSWSGCDHFTVVAVPYQNTGVSKPDPKEVL